MKIRILAVGGMKSSEIRTLAEEYKKRMQPHVELDIREIREEAVKDGNEITEEGKRILKELKKNRTTAVALTEEGQQYSSMQFSRFVFDTIHQDQLCFIIGGFSGLSQEVKSSCSHQISFSKMTFTRDFARLILTEQLYRALKIHRGEPYHR